jgi:hypothetical protein
MMNKRIFKLAKQADLIQWDTLPSGAKTPDHESVVKAKKFAELIVKECAKRVESKADRWGNMTDEIINECILECAKDLKEHFGVE